jgi:hypothetical protein
MTVNDWVVVVWTLAVVCAFYGVLMVVQAGVFASGWSGGLFAAAGVFGVVGGVLRTMGGRSPR